MLDKDSLFLMFALSHQFSMLAVLTTFLLVKI